MKLATKKLMGLVSVLLLSVTLVACNQNGSSSQKVGVIDMNVLFQTPAVQQMGQQLMQQAGPEQAKLKAAYQQVMAMRSEAAKAKPAQKKAMDEKLKAQETSFATMMRNAQQDQAKQERAMQDKVNAAVAKVAGSEGLSFVYAKQAVLFGNTVDITDKVAKQLS